MPVHDDVIFGPDEAHQSGKMTYGRLRGLSEPEKIVALKARMDTFLVEQSEELSKETEKIYAPFPLFVMTCVAIEAHGIILYYPKREVSREDAQRQGFLKVCGKIHQGFSKKLSAQEKKDYETLWVGSDHKHPKSISEMIYRFGRHTMMHGFRGRGVHLSESIAEWKWHAGALHLNPYWFWRAFCDVYDIDWKETLTAAEPTDAKRRSAIRYLNDLTG